MAKKITGLMTKEQRIYGLNACLGVFRARPEDIIQLFVSKETLRKVSELTKYCAKNKKAYHVVSDEELAKITKATHHEGISMLIRQKAEKSLVAYLASKPKKSLLLALEDVSNPHNIGAILRSAAHFGVTGLIVTDKKACQTASCIRTSEGGSEFVEIFETKDFKKTIKDLAKNNFQIITTSSHAKENLYEVAWQDRSVVVFGEETNGLSKDLLQTGTLIKIPGTDYVESLNVSVATAVILSDYYSKVTKNANNQRFK